MMILGRNQDGIFPLYHSPQDNTFDQTTFAPLLETLEHIATESFPNSHSKTHYSALILGGLSLPSWMVWFLNFMGITAGALDFRHAKSSLKTLFLSVVPLFLCFLFCASLVSFGIFGSTQEELTVMNTFGIPNTGWWSAAPFVSVLGIGIYFLFRWRIRTKGSSSLLCSFFLS